MKKKYNEMAMMCSIGSGVKKRDCSQCLFINFSTSFIVQACRQAPDDSLFPIQMQGDSQTLSLINVSEKRVNLNGIK